MAIGETGETAGRSQSKGKGQYPTDSPKMADNSDYQSIRALVMTENGIYEFMENAYFGTGGFRNGMYLVPDSAELQMYFQRRQDMAFYKNYVYPIIRAMIDPVFNHEIERDIVVNGESVSKGMYINEFMKNATANGTTYKAFIDEQLTYAIVHGITFTVMDNYRIDEMPENKELALKERKLPMVHRRSICEVDSWNCDKNGNLEWIVFQDDCVKNEKGVEEKRFSGWYSDRYEEIGEDESGKRTVLNTVFHGLGVLPVIMTIFGKRKKPKNIKVDPPLFDMANVNAAIYNKDSEIRRHERTQGMGVLCVQTDKADSITVGRHNYIAVPPGVPNMPVYASADPAILTGLNDGSTRLKNDLLEIANSNGVNSKTNQVKSGDALEWEFEAKETTLKVTAALAQDLETNIIELFKLYTKEEFEYRCIYPDSYAPDNSESELSNIDKVLMMTMPPKAASHLREMAYRIVTKREDEDRVAEAVEEFTVEQPDGDADTVEQEEPEPEAGEGE